jgi:RNA polymerase sigma-70 factor (ECF subfamily)
LSDTAGISDLIKRSRQGEEAAREELFARYRQYLKLLADMQIGRRLRAKTEASDVVQQTLLEAHRDFKAFTGTHEGELLAWLRRILSNNLFNEARYHAAKQRAASREVSLEQLHAGVESSSMTLSRCLADDDAPTPSTIALQHENAVKLADCLARLPQDYQTVLLLRIFEGLPAEEVARRMSRTAGAIRMLQLRALNALRDEMNKSDESASQS